MRNLPILIVMAIPIASLAQQSNSGNEIDSVTYVIRVNDEQLEALRNGKSLESAVPPEYRGKFGIIRIEYVPPVAPTGANGNSTTRSPNSGTESPQRLATGSNPSAPNSPSAWQNAQAANGGGQLNLSSNNPSNSIMRNDPQSNATLNPAPPLFNPNNSQPLPPINTGPPWPTNNSGQPLNGSLNSIDNRSTRVTPEDSSFFWGGFDGNNRSNLTPLQVNDQYSLGRQNNRTAGIERNDGSQIATSASELPTQADLRRQNANDSAIEIAYSSPPVASRPLSVPSLPVLNSLSASSPSTSSAADRSPSESLGKLVVPPTQTEEALAAQVTELTSKNKDQSKRMWFLFLFLMCSLGVNVYLLWISRGFYARYHEMAAELRETFTSAGT